MNEEQIRAIIRDELQNILKSDRYVFDKKIQLLDARHIQLGKTTGTKIGTETTQKLGFFGKTPVTQQALSPVAAGAIASDGVARSGVNAIITALQNIGISS